MIELFLIHGSPYAWRVQLALEYKGIAYETRVLSLAQGDLKAPDFLAKSPRGRVPLLCDGEFSISESLAILTYLERQFPEPALFGTSSQESASIWRHIAEYTSYVDAAVEHFILPLYFGRARELESQVRDAATTLTRELATYDDLLAHRAYLDGETVTGADIVVFPHIQSVLRAAGKPDARAFDLPFLPLDDRCPNIARWIARMETLPGYPRTYPPNWR